MCRKNVERNASSSTVKSNWKKRPIEWRDACNMGVSVGHWQFYNYVLQYLYWKHDYSYFIYHTTLNSYREREGERKIQTAQQQQQHSTMSWWIFYTFRCHYFARYVLIQAFCFAVQSKNEKYNSINVLWRKKKQTTTQHKFKQLRHAEEKTDLVAHHSHTYFSNGDKEIFFGRQVKRKQVPIASEEWNRVRW